MIKLEIEKKGKKTDYVARLYLGSIGKIDKGIVSVNAYAVYCNITFPLIVKVFKPKGTLKAEDKYQTKIELAAETITELINEGFNIKLVLADSLSGESSQFLSNLAEHNLDYVVAIRSNHAVCLPAKALGRVVLLSEHLAIQSQRLDTLGK